MINQLEVDKWLDDFLKRLNESFKDRLIFVGHHGSWARGEAKLESDIDTIVVLDHINLHDLDVFRDIISSMPDAKKLASGALLSVHELQVWPRFDLVQLFYGCKVLHGTLNGIIEKTTAVDLIDSIKVIASANSHHARHYLLYPHDLNKVVHNLKYPFKNCFYALQAWTLLKENKYVARKNDILETLKEADDKEVVLVARDWKELEEDRTKRPLYYINLLERWSRNMLLRLQTYKD
jgi:predicted nucleotidyltransferase